MEGTRVRGSRGGARPRAGGRGGGWGRWSVGRVRVFKVKSEKGYNHNISLIFLFNFEKNFLILKNLDQLNKSN